MAIIYFITCNLIVAHSRDDEKDYTDGIRRIFGKK
jgi:hypothetical protein